MRNRGLLLTALTTVFTLLATGAATAMPACKLIHANLGGISLCI